MDLHLNVTKLQNVTDIKRQWRNETQVMIVMHFFFFLVKMVFYKAVNPLKYFSFNSSFKLQWKHSVICELFLLCFGSLKCSRCYPTRLNVIISYPVSTSSKFLRRYGHQDRHGTFEEGKLQCLKGFFGFLLNGLTSDTNKQSLIYDLLHNIYS